MCAHSESLGKRMHAFLFTMEYSCHISREHFFETLGRSIPGQWNRIRVLCASVQEGAGMETGLSSSRNAKDSISLVYECARDCLFLMNVPARDHSHESREQIPKFSSAGLLISMKRWPPSSWVFKVKVTLYMSPSLYIPIPSEHCPGT